MLRIVQQNVEMTSKSKLNAQWFQSELKAKNITQRALAKALGLDPSGVTLIFTHKRRLRLDEAPVVANLLGASLDDVLLNAGIANQGMRLEGSVKVIGAVNAEFEVLIGKAKGPKSVPYPPQSTKRIEALRVEASDTPYDGAIIYVATTEMSAREAIGQIGLIKVEGKRNPLIRQIKRGYQSGKFNLGRLDGQPGEEDVRVLSFKPLLWMRF